MVNRGNHSDALEPDDDHISKAEHVESTGRTRRARIYGSIKRMASKFWTEDASPTNGPPKTSAASSPLISRLTDAADGLTFTSETDAPVEVFVWPEGTPFSAEALRVHEHIDAAEPLETEEVDHFFRNVTKPREWHEAAEKEQVRRFGALRDLLKAELTDVAVYRLGSTAISVYVLGRAADGTTTGIRTKVVET
jgi:hypothetical protein